MQVYYYNPSTKYYTHSESIKLDKTASFICPSSATFYSPPKIEEGEWLVFNGFDWTKTTIPPMHAIYIEKRKEIENKYEKLPDGIIVSLERSLSNANNFNKTEQAELLRKQLEEARAKYSDELEKLEEWLNEQEE